MEDKDQLIKRINEAADFMSKATGETHEQALNRLCISPQCGFASHEHGNPVDFDDVSPSQCCYRGVDRSLIEAGLE